MSSYISKITYENTTAISYDLWSFLASASLDWISQQEEDSNVFYIGKRPDNAEKIIREELEAREEELHEEDIKFLLTCEEDEDYIIQS